VRWFTNAAAIPFVANLLRYNDDGRSKMSQMMSDPTAKGNLPSSATAAANQKPGDAKWVPLFSPKGEAISMHPICRTAIGRPACLPNTTEHHERRGDTRVITIYDKLIIAFYFVFILAVGLIFVG